VFILTTAREHYLLGFAVGAFGTLVGAGGGSPGSSRFWKHVSGRRIQQLLAAGLC
jgi:hypothetical protein